MTEPIGIKATTAKSLQTINLMFSEKSGGRREGGGAGEIIRWDWARLRCGQSRDEGQTDPPSPGTREATACESALTPIMVN